MPIKCVSDYLKMTTADLKSRLSENGRFITGNKKVLVGRLMDYEELHDGVTLKHDVAYKPTKEELKYGIVSNVPMKIQEKVCKIFAEHLEKNYTQTNPMYDKTTSASASFAGILKSLLVYRNDVYGESAYYLGVTKKVHQRDSCGLPDKNGRVFVSALADLAGKIWEETLNRWGDDFNVRYCIFREPMQRIAHGLRNMLKNKREEVDEHEKKQQQEAMIVFLNGCLNQNSGSPFLPLIAPLYSYGPIRKEIEGYVGVST